MVKSGEVRARVKLIEEKEVKKVEPEYDPVNRNFWKDDEESEDDEVVTLKVHSVRTRQPAQVQEEVQLQDEVQQLEEEQLQEVQQQEEELQALEEPLQQEEPQEVQLQEQLQA